MLEVPPISSVTVGGAGGVSAQNQAATTEMDDESGFAAQMKAQNTEMMELGAQQRAVMKDYLKNAENKSLIEMLERMTVQTEMSIADREASAQLKRLTGKFQLIDDMLQKLS